MTEHIDSETAKQMLKSSRAGFGHVEGISDLECVLLSLAASRHALQERTRERDDYRHRAEKAEAERNAFRELIDSQKRTSSLCVKREILTDR